MVRSAAHAGLACVCFAVDRFNQGEALIDAAHIAGRAAQGRLRDTAQPRHSQGLSQSDQPRPNPHHQQEAEHDLPVEQR
jgi:hypothetical protein